jgi:hypothetical protein
VAAALKRAVAGDRVWALVDGLSVDLIGEEETCRQNMEALFTGGVPAAAGKLGTVLSRGARSVPDVAADVTSSASRVVAATDGPFRSLLVEAVGRGLESIREELTLCERTLGPRFGGLASEACDAADDVQDQFIQLGMVQYRANAGTVLGWFTEQLSLELRVALQLKESPETVVGRLVSPVPLRLAQHSGRGLWWKVLEHCNRITREIEFATVNAARTEAMTRFNRIGEDR